MANADTAGDPAKPQIMAIEAIQEACVRAKARLVSMPEGPDIEQKALQVERNDGSLIDIPIVDVTTDKNRDAAIAGLVALIQKAKPAKS